MSARFRDRLSARSPTLEAIWTGVCVLAVQVAALAAYVDLRQPVFTAPWMVGYPAVWITAGTVTAVWVGRTVVGRRRRGLGVAVGAAYTGVLLWMGGLLAAGSSTGHRTVVVEPAVPGWGPVVSYSGAILDVSIVPFKLIAYLALGYVVYVLVAGTGRSVRAAALGVASCVSCTASALLAAAGAVGVAGSASLAGAVGYEVPTVALLVTFGLLARAARTASKPASCRPIVDGANR